MATADLVAPCGMNCALCANHLALANDVKSKGIKMPYCAGCRPRNKKCAFLKKQCSKLLDGKVSFCFECNHFPCEPLKKIDSRYKTRYRMSMIENLHFIKENGVQRFLEEQEKLWKCPNCGEMICCHNGVCFNCGLEKLKRKKERYRWSE
jgi:ribosomal protein L32